MPSTDIDGQPVLIINETQAQAIVSMALRARTQFDREKELVERVCNLFPKLGEAYRECQRWTL